MKNEVYVLRRVQDNYFLDQKRIIKGTTLKVGNKTYLLDLKSPVYIRTKFGQTKAVYLILNTGEQLKLNKCESMDPKVFDNLISSQIFKNLIMEKEKISWTERIVFLIIGAVLGALVGILLGLSGVI